MGGAQRQNANRQQFGADAEELAVQLLERTGYQIRARNFRCRYGELDIVAENDRALCFVEVRMRSHSTWGDPLQTVMSSKQRRVIKAALHYLFVYGDPAKDIRFDVVSVVGRGGVAEVEHIPAAFDAGM